MANGPGPKQDIKFCPVCKASLRNVPRSEMKSRGYKKRRHGIEAHAHR